MRYRSSAQHEADKHVLVEKPLTIKDWEELKLSTMVIHPTNLCDNRTGPFCRQNYRMNAGFIAKFAWTGGVCLDESTRSVTNKMQIT